MSTTVFWFGDDLRVCDNALLRQAADQSGKLICVFILPSEWLQQQRLGPNRLLFLQQSLHDLNTQLNALGQQLHVITGDPVNALQTLINEFAVSQLFRAHHPGLEERNWLAAIARSNPTMQIQGADSLRLWSSLELPFAIDQLPPTFSQARKQLEILAMEEPVAAPDRLPPPPRGLRFEDPTLTTCSSKPGPLVEGGCSAAHQHLNNYFGSFAPSTYKETRNTLDTFTHSTKFSPWLARGSISPREIMAALQQYEHQRGANQSTYWIFFELMWREYFHLYAWRDGQRLFSRNGHRDQLPYTLDGNGDFNAWRDGQTPFALVNACMHQLNETGYMSNRGRQLAASCLVNELGLDWRLGAAWFERQLIDYDVASNWGNWQYLAGVGADPRGLRRFNQAKQQQVYDPDGAFIKRWQPQQASN